MAKRIELNYYNGETYEGLIPMYVNFIFGTEGWYTGTNTTDKNVIKLEINATENGAFLQNFLFMVSGYNGDMLMGIGMPGTVAGMNAFFIGNNTTTRSYFVDTSARDENNKLISVISIDRNNIRENMNADNWYSYIFVARRYYIG